jgi:cobalt-zinc-cadmium resistance protein CzcA
VELQRVARLERSTTPSVITRNDAQRRIVVGFNVRGSDLEGVVERARATLARDVQLPAGYRFEWGGQLQSLEQAQGRLSLVIPGVLLLVIGILAWMFRHALPAGLIFLNVPIAGVGGVLSLVLRDMPISISAMVGLIVLAGIAVLNGVVLMSQIERLRAEGSSPHEAAREAALKRMRPVLMTALVAALGFVPMMFATGVGAEVQRPLATVVVGGLVTSTLLTLLVLPALYGRLRAAPRR